MPAVEAVVRDDNLLMMVFDTLAEAEAALQLLQEANPLLASRAFLCLDAAELARLDLPAEDTAPYRRYLQQGRVVVAVRAAPAVRARLRAILEPAGAYAVRWWRDSRPGAAATRSAPGRTAAPAFALDVAGAGDRDLHALSPPLAGPLPPTETEFRSGGEASRAAQPTSP